MSTTYVSITGQDYNARGGGGNYLRVSRPAGGAMRDGCGL